MTAIWAGALLMLVGLASRVARPLLRGWLGGAGVAWPRPPAASGEDEPDLNLDLETNPCLALVALGAILVLAGLCAWLTGDLPAGSA
jgi:hypothetical protein